MGNRGELPEDQRKAIRAWCRELSEQGRKDQADELFTAWFKERRSRPRD